MGKINDKACESEIYAATEARFRVKDPIVGRTLGECAAEIVKHKNLDPVCTPKVTRLLAGMVSKGKIILDDGVLKALPIKANGKPKQDVKRPKRSRSVGRRILAPRTLIRA